MPTKKEMRSALDKVLADLPSQVDDRMKKASDDLAKALTPKLQQMVVAEVRKAQPKKPAPAKKEPKKKDKPEPNDQKAVRPEPKKSCEQRRLRRTG